MSTKPIEWYARRYAEKYGMHLIPIREHSKLPAENDWGNHTINDPSQAEDFWTDNPELNIGMALGPSGLCSLDIDCDESFQTILDEFGIDADELWKFPTIQGSQKGRRIVFRVPEGAELPYAKLNWKREDDDSKSYTVFELRAACDGRQRFDMLPPSIHPDTGKPYAWIVQPPKPGTDWPTPPAWLLAMWGAWDKFKPQLQAACPWAVVETPAPARTQAPRQENGSNVIQAFNDAHDLRMTLERYGYSRKGKSRYLSPHTSTGLPGVVLFPDERRCFIHHASDPLCSDESGQPVNPFDLFCYYEHNNDASKAVKAAAELLGLKPERRTPAAKAMQAAPEPTTPTSEDEAPPPQEHANSGPFKALGYNGGAYYYLPRGTEQVCEIKRGSHTSPAELMSLAPIEWWESIYPKGKQGGCDWQLAASDCMRLCERVGIYSHERERGRGAWFDDGRPVLHLGDRLLVDGSPTAISDHGSRFIYTKQAPIETGHNAEPADDATAEQFALMFDQLNWSSPVHSIYAAGFCALAPICGGLSWRPHLWLTARRGAGKSWIQDHMVGPLIGPGALMVQGSTTEAGIRQALKHDARPIVFDEAESEDANSQRRMQTVIELARQSSSDSTAQIVKGTVNGSGLTFRMRSMFLLGSINVALSQAADESRFTVVSINPPDKTKEEIERFGRFSLEVDNLFTNENCAAVRARIFRLMPVIRKNAKAFATAVAELLGSQRIGDQVGTLIAGWWALSSRNAVSVQEARVIVEQLDFSDAKEAEAVSDEESCLARILQSQVRFDSSEGQKQRTLGELVSCAAGKLAISGVHAIDANDILGRYGLRVESQFVHVANQHAELARLMKDSSWAAGWRRILARIDGAGPSPEPVRFAGSRSRATRIPIESVTF